MYYFWLGRDADRDDIEQTRSKVMNGQDVKNGFLAFLNIGYMYGKFVPVSHVEDFVN